MNDLKNGHSSMLDGLVDSGVLKRHQGLYPPAKYPDHYGTPFK